MLKSRASRARAAIVAVVIALAVFACATMRSGGGGGGGDNNHAAATTPATTPTTTSPATTTPAGAPVVITIKDVRNKKGNLIFGVFRTPDGFPTVESKSVYWEVRAAAADSHTFTAHLPPGRYGASVLHDENGNGDMDRGIGGIPLEGYGVTNNPKPLLRAATFKEATFDLPPSGATMTISMQYFQ
jgi:uncharacterized protein (DUF2141 family)